ncbi:hypothetical protein NDU88_006436 [Pleurodeles waltl]|uniref:Uncharacterized protein n=1 Tax=Pleurodeles waltl TaxID=8319 RepID=A0AAV7TDZ5_PLEWA|nr:hypothetical protein NDU88_006436 [Pleurodeles waltl]
MVLLTGFYRSSYPTSSGAFEELRRMQATTEEQEEDLPEGEEVDLEDEAEEENDLATGPELKHPEEDEEDTFPTGVQSPTRTWRNVSASILTPEELEDSRAERELKLQLPKFKME